MLMSVVLVSICLVLYISCVLLRIQIFSTFYGFWYFPKFSLILIWHILLYLSCWSPILFKLVHCDKVLPYIFSLYVLGLLLTTITLLSTLFSIVSDLVNTFHYPVTWASSLICSPPTVLFLVLSLLTSLSLPGLILLLCLSTVTTSVLFGW
jgi:hypothetical protein